MERAIGVRKGAWSKQEDDLLRACIQRYDDRKWHLVPQRAGLNRCRKSCRLRWMNYLKPDIKRGNFAEDEVDMIMRFHRLLGNRWSLIAARFPGRTPNDVKNFCNTYMRKRRRQQYYCSSQNNDKEEKHEETTKTHQVITPQPLTFSRKSSRLRGNPMVAINNNNTDDGSGNSIEPHHQRIDDKNGDDRLAESAASPQESQKSREWWESLLDDVRGGDERDSLWGLDAEKEGTLLLADFWDEELNYWTYPKSQ